MHRLLITAILLAGCGAGIPDAVETPAHSDPRFARAIAASREILLARAKTLPGIGVAVAVDGALVWTSGFGFAGLESRTPMRADTPARVYSVSKPLTAALALRLEERGALDLSQPIGRIVPSLPPAIAAITTAQLLSHTSGIRHYNDGEWLKVSSAPCTAPREALAPFINDPLLFSPGSKSEYSSFAYVLASLVLETAAKRPFHELLREEVLQRANMKSTTPLANGASTFYEPARFGRVKVSRPVDNTCKFGGGSLHSTAPDLASFGAALLDQRVVNAASLARMTQSRTDFALGLGVATDETLGPIAAASGAAIGGMSYLLLAPRDRVVVAIVANMEGERFRDDARAIARSFAERR